METNEITKLNGGYITPAVARLAIGAIAACFAIGMAKADTDGITNSSNVPVSAHLFKCGAAPTPAGTAWTPSAFSFDISWVDPDLHAYFLADRSHNGVTTTSGGNGDVLLIDIESINLTSPNATVDDPNSTTYLLPPADDPMAGMGCDMNTAFGGTAGVGRNEITGPNGLFTVTNAEIWVGDGPGKFQPLQGDGTVTLTNGSATITSCASMGAVCTYSGVPSDYVEPILCNSSVRVFDVASRAQADRPYQRARLLPHRRGRIRSGGSDRGLRQSVGATDHQPELRGAAQHYAVPHLHLDCASRAGNRIYP